MKNSTLITVFNGTIANQTVQLANARSLHEFLEVKSQFGHWISDRISDYGFVQDEDYIIVTERTNGRPRKEYHITLDMGKELAMVERNEKGRMVRKYFIECERKALQQPQQLALPEPKPDVVIPYDQAYWIAKYLIRAKAFGKEVEIYQRQLFECIGIPRYVGKNDLAGKGYDLANEFNHKIDPFIEQIFPQTLDVKRISNF
ncbi:phage anti-repressor protein [Pasteurella langaaensis DSM 22999]|uniref:Phage anti-repressor protein n=1 Tax=Alitibacter langaaensis DSM 22999 TaxID=1122935 RepID=A0A2U0TAI1_9PAST|nr:antA/AntB antirepressor family protein [Pasteurella langaaensis]PVX40588.1 phage anti-repressor protein [Pasteurella langaaensis DSM 22999]